jgi:hypothetical protein
MKYFVYVYSADNGTAYYVGKGSLKRVFMKHDVPVPRPELIQKFSFATEQEAWETEIQLISLFGRQQDGGTLLNLSTGGKSGMAGVVQSECLKQRRSLITKKYHATNGHPSLGLTGSKSLNSRAYIINFPDGNVVEIVGLNAFCREHNLDPSAMCRVSKGKATHHKGFTCSRI